MAFIWGPQKDPKIPEMDRPCLPNGERGKMKIGPYISPVMFTDPKMQKNLLTFYFSK